MLVLRRSVLVKARLKDGGTMEAQPLEQDGSRGSKIASEN